MKKAVEDYINQKVAERQAILKKQEKEKQKNPSVVLHPPPLDSKAQVSFGELCKDSEERFQQGQKLREADRNRKELERLQALHLARPLEPGNCVQAKSGVQDEQSEPSEQWTGMLFDQNLVVFGVTKIGDDWKEVDVKWKYVSQSQNLERVLPCPPNLNLVGELYKRPQHWPADWKDQKHLPLQPGNCVQETSAEKRTGVLFDNKVVVFDVPFYGAHGAILDTPEEMNAKRASVEPNNLVRVLPCPPDDEDHERLRRVLSLYKDE